MDNYSYWKRPLQVRELREELEHIDDETNVPDNIVILPPENANEENTDEDSGDEDVVEINNLPGSQLRSEVEVFNMLLHTIVQVIYLPMKYDLFRAYCFLVIMSVFQEKKCFGKISKTKKTMLYLAQCQETDPDL
ncbi:hypothetical protein QE152_g17120 [Popillia japonica]|uniref:Uncharacterized protein n=1 Tax=Popillia japonica TaxID=7064 RepID=A0AAW1L2B8_POPJA